MIRNILILSAVLSFCVWVPAQASTAGDVSYDASGNPLPVSDPAISRSVPESVKNQPKRIEIDLSDQTLSYYYGDYLVTTIKISSGVAKLPTPTGSFNILSKIPTKDYYGRNLNGSIYGYKNTLWNLKFSTRGYYIHGAYWHSNFGQPMSHGCINVSYTDMPQLYEFAKVGTLVSIHK